MKKCAKCGKENRDEAGFCADCGAKLDASSSNLATDGNKCPECGKTNLKEATFCSNCGAKLNKSDSSLANSSSSSSYSSNQFSSSSKINPASSSGSSSSSNAHSSSSSKSSSSSDLSNAGNNQDEGPSRLKICCCYVPVILFVVFIAFALIYHGFAESFPVTYGYDYSVLDLNGDGKLSYFEASQLDTSIPNSTMTGYFNDADTNNNGFLKGHEFELFYDDVDSYYTLHSDSDSDKYKYSSSSSSSSS